MFINSAIVPLAVYWDNWYGFNSLIMEIYNIILSNAILSPLLLYLNLGYAFRRYQQWALERAGDMNKATQQQANNLFEGPLYDIAVRYSNLNKTFLICCFYGPILPQTFLITLASFVVEYLVSKYLLLRRFRRPEMLGNDLSKIMLKFIAIGAIVLCTSTILFHGNYNSLSIIPSIVGYSLCCFFILIPFYKFNKLRKIMTKVDIL
jgi:hypothetical protein